MTPEAFRALALSQTEAVESGHMGKADFRVGGKIFATLSADARVGTLRLDPEQQQTALSLAGSAAWPATGSWGRQGWTQFGLNDVDEGLIGPLIHAAWVGRAPKKLLKAAK